MDETLGESRPKIHRLPQQPPVKDSELYVSRAVLIVCLALLLVAVIPALISFSKIDKKNMAATISPEQSKIISATAPDTAPDNPNLAVRDAQGQMVGQLAKMPADVERGASINTMSKVDNASGKELMNIISKD